MATPEPSTVLAITPIVYRDVRRAGPVPADGELHVFRSDLGNRCLARLVLEQGPEALPRGAGPVHVIVVKPDPTLDDMLAATIAAVRLDGRPLPIGIRPFVEYATVLRKGLSPGTAVPLERSLAGLYKAIRWMHLDLTDPAQGRRFTEDWNRLAAVILAYAADGLDPFSEFPLPSWLFAEEQLFLTGDRDLYLRDKLAGEAWDVIIPDEGPTAGRRPALLLRRPTSRLWKEWARSDPAASRSGWRPGKGEPGPVGYQFLAVDEEGTGNWVFSTNPVHRLSIRSLRDLLQKEEQARSPKRAADDPWVALFDDTLVAAPAAGTAIPETELIRLVKRWANARTVRPRRRLAAGVALATLGCLMLVALLGAHRAVGPAAAATPSLVRVEQEGQPAQYLRFLPEQEGARSAEVDVHVKPGRPFDLEFPLRLRAPQPVLLSVGVTLPEGGPPLNSPITITVNDQSLGEAPVTALGAGVTTEPTAAYLHAGENTIRVRLVNDRPEDVRAQVRVTWAEHPHYQPDLYLLAIGTRRYRSQAELPLAEQDATDLVGALRSQEGPGRPFRKVRALPAGQPLLHPTRDQLLEALGALKRQAPEGAVAWVLISGHGVVAPDGRFYLVLAGPDGADEKVSWDDVYAQIDQVRCPVVVLLDTCSSGQIHTDVATLSRLAFGKQSHVGRVLISASYDRAHEADEWGHSALCLACLECLRGEYLFNRAVAQPDLAHYARGGAEDRRVTLEDFRRYLVDRVEKLYEWRGDRQAARIGVNSTPALDMARIAVAGGRTNDKRVTP
jgi:hypothetical protein